VTQVLVLAMAFSFLAVAAAIGVTLALNPEWLNDKEHPDVQRYRQHQPSRVVREAPEREDVTT
jgi:hypothetical protein